MWNVASLDSPSLLICVGVVILGGAEDQTRSCKCVSTVERLERRTRGPFKRAESGLGVDPAWVRGGTKEACQKALQLFFSVKSYQEHSAIPLHRFAFEARPQFPFRSKDFSYFEIVWCNVPLEITVPQQSTFCSYNFECYLFNKLAAVYQCFSYPGNQSVMRSRLV